jgi:3-keto-5-aminohexanoate cleavage enzyme
VAVLGGDIFESDLPALALERGGHLRVGLEDHKGRTVTNEELVAEAVAVIEKSGRPLASCAETTALLGL